MGLKKVLAAVYRNTMSALPTSIKEKTHHSISKESKGKRPENTLDVDVDGEPVNGIERDTTYHDKQGKSKLQITSLIGLLMIIVITFSTLLGSFNGSDSPQCRSIYMYPAYARIDGFDSRFTSLAQKYHLYLYREQGKDRNPMENEEIQLDGIPVLFIPGNAGSYKQVRSIAAASSNIFFEDKESIENMYTKNLDFFAADFNEDFTAFHGRTMIDQAEYLNDAIRYILSLYEQSKSYIDPLPTSVIVIGHSMGGVVARLLPTLQNHVDYSIRALITLSSPHALAPVTFDGDILKIYQRTNDYWRNQMNDKSSFLAQNVSLVSITGGILDMMLPADYTAVEDILPIQNGFTTYSTTIPEVWTPIDHLAVVWCDQLRSKVARLLLEIVDGTTAEKVRPLRQRMFVSRKMLLSGLEDEMMQDLELIDPKKYSEVYESQDFREAYDLKGSQRLSISRSNKNQFPRYSKFILPSDGQNTTFSFLTSLQEPQVFFCKLNQQLEEATHSKSSMNCVSAFHDMATVPASSSDLEFPAQSSLDDVTHPFKMLSIDKRILSQYDFIVVENKKAAIQNDQDFIYAGLTSDKISTDVSERPVQLVFSGMQLTLNSSFLYHTFRFPKLWDSLLSYRVSCSSKAYTSDRLIFEPLIRQWIEDPFETKWHVNINNSDIDINMHNVAPFIPLEELHDKSLMLTVIVPPNYSLELCVRINWTLTLKMLFIRYRLTFLSLPISLACIIVAYQFFNYRQTREFITFNSALASVLKRGLVLALAIILLSPATNSKPLQRILFMLDPIRLNQPFLLEEEHIHTNFYFLGIRSWFMSPLGLFFMVMSVAILYLIASIFDFIESLVIAISVRFAASAIRNEVRLKDRPSINKPRRTITSFLLIGIVFFYVPYQIASAVSLLIQIGTCFRVAIKSTRSGFKNYDNLRNYNFSVFLILSFVVAINAPIIVVFLHNVAIRWETPFRSHHNVLAIAPIIFLVSTNSAFNMPLFKSGKFYENGISAILFGYTGVFCLIYGARNLYWIHHLFNITCAWLLLTIFSNNAQTDNVDKAKITQA